MPKARAAARRASSWGILAPRISRTVAATRCGSRTADRRRAGLLRELLPIRVDDDGDVKVGRGRQTERPLQMQVDGRRIEQVDAADHRGDPLLRVVERRPRGGRPAARRGARSRSRRSSRRASSRSALGRRRRTARCRARRALGPRSRARGASSRDTCRGRDQSLRRYPRAARYACSCSETRSPAFRSLEQAAS